MDQRCILQRWYTYKSEYLRDLKTEFENILGCESGAHMGSIIEKNQRSTFSCYCTFKHAWKKPTIFMHVSMCYIPQHTRQIWTYNSFYMQRRKISDFLLGSPCTFPWWSPCRIGSEVPPPPQEDRPPTVARLGNRILILCPGKGGRGWSPRQIHKTSIKSMLMTLKGQSM